MYYDIHFDTPYLYDHLYDRVTQYSTITKVLQ